MHGWNPEVWTIKWAVLSCGDVLLCSLVLTLSQWMKPWNVTIQMKAIEQSFPVVMFYCAVWCLRWVSGWIPEMWPFKWKLLSSPFLWWCFTVQFGANVESVDESLKCDHSNESYWAILSCGDVLLCSLVLKFESVDQTLKCDHSK